MKIPLELLREGVGVDVSEALRDGLDRLAFEQHHLGGRQSLSLAVFVHGYPHLALKLLAQTLVPHTEFPRYLLERQLAPEIFLKKLARAPR